MYVLPWIKPLAEQFTLYSAAVGEFSPWTGFSIKFTAFWDQSQKAVHTYWPAVSVLFRLFLCGSEQRRPGRQRFLFLEPDRLMSVLSGNRVVKESAWIVRRDFIFSCSMMVRLGWFGWIFTLGNSGCLDPITDHDKQYLLMVWDSSGSCVNTHH